MRASTTTLFDRTYKGPWGKHLNHRTVRTVTGNPAPTDKQVSIHPSKFYAGKTVRRGGAD